jgi:hypothetical protein
MSSKGSKGSFDRALLKRPTSERLKHFRSYVVKHKRLVTVDEQIAAALKEPADAGLVFIVGPTGIGKSTIKKVIYQRVIQAAMAEMETDPGYLPIAGIEIIATGKMSYNWHDHWYRALEALEEPLIKNKVMPKRSKIDRPSSGARLREQTAALRRSFESGAKNRRLQFFTLDEAQHFTHVAPSLLRYQVETIKSVANLSRALHLMFGTYELLLLRNASGQLGRRALTIHFDRYHVKSDQDIVAFAEVVKSFQVQMPLPETPDFLPHLEYCFERSLGCVGLLKDWFSRALADAVNKGAKTVTVRDLQKHEFPASVLLTVSAEILDGESKLKEQESAFALLRERLGISSRLRKEAKEGNKRAPSKRARRGFAARKPRRDKVGGGRAATNQPED